MTIQPGGKKKKKKREQGERKRTLYNATATSLCGFFHVGGGAAHKNLLNTKGRRKKEKDRWGKKARKVHKEKPT